MRVILISLLFSFVIFACHDSEKEEVILPEIELVSPTTEQGEIVLIPINTPIMFQAKLSGKGEGDINWYLEDDGELHSMNEYHTFTDNGFYKVNFYYREGAYSSNTFIWVNVVGQVVTDIANDEVGCAVMELYESIYVLAKKRDAYTKPGMFLYKYTGGELEKSDYYSDVNYVLDVQRSEAGNLLVLGDNSFLSISNNENLFQSTPSTPFSKAHIQKNSQNDFLLVGANDSQDKIIAEKRNQEGVLISKSTLSDDYNDQLIDAVFLNDSIILQLESTQNSGENNRMDLMWKNIKNGTDKYLYDFSGVDDLKYWNDGGFIKCDSCTILYGYGEYKGFSIIKLKDDLPTESSWVNSFGVPFSDDNYICGGISEDEFCHDKRLWGWEFEGGFVFLLQNQMIRIETGNHYPWAVTKRIFDVRSSFKIDWAFKSGDSVLLLANTKKVNEHGVYNKRFCTVFRMNLKGEFIDL